MATKTKTQEQPPLPTDQPAASDVQPAGDVALVPAKAREWVIPKPWLDRNATESQVRTMFNLFPGAHPASVMAAWDYCVARNLDPLKKPCHIVPMRVKDHNGKWEWRDVIMPGIYEYRTTAHRTGEYMGHSKPEYGDPLVFEELGYKRPVPEWCSMTFYRWNRISGTRVEFTVTVYFEEVVQLKDGKANNKWLTSPRQMLTIRTESAGLRAAFPDELGGTHTAEEMEGRVIDTTAIDSQPETSAAAPEGYGIWFDSLVTAAQRGAQAMQEQFAAGPVEYRDHLTKNTAAWEALKATAVMAGA